MAVNLTHTWNQHAFPDDEPGREERWLLDSERRRIADRTDFNLEQSGSTNKIRRFTSGKDDELNGKTAKEKADDDMMMLLAVGSPAYMEAYNNRLTLTVGGDNFEITQGELHDRAKQRAEDLRRQIDAAKQRGASPEEIARLEEDRVAFLIIRDNANPRLGDVTPDRRQAIDNAIAGNASAQDMVRQEGRPTPSAGQTHSGAEIVDRMDNEARADRVANEIDGTGGRSSFASSIEAAKPATAVASLSTSYAEAANGLPPADRNLGNTSEPAEPSKTPGISL